MGRRLLLPFVLAYACSASTWAAEDIFADLEEIYLTVFEDAVHDHKRDDRVLAVAMAIKDDARLIRMPDRMWKRLKKRLEAKGEDLSKYVSADDVVWRRDSRFIHKPSGKEVWVYTISGIDWHGTNRLYVSQYRSHGSLPEAKSTLVLGKKNETWTIVNRPGTSVADRKMGFTSTWADGDIFADFEEIYLTVFEDVVRDQKRLNRALAVAMAIKDDGSVVRMPDRLWKRLKKKLEAKSVDLSKFVSADDIVWNNENLMYIHKPSGKDAWVSAILGVDWHGTNGLYVSQCVTHGNLATGGSTLMLVKRNKTWAIAGRIGPWVSVREKGRDIFDNMEIAAALSPTISVGANN